jgi:hypothetical protein
MSTSVNILNGGVKPSLFFLRQLFGLATLACRAVLDALVTQNFLSRAR